MERHLVELRAELHQLKPFSCVPAVLLSRVTGHARGALFGSGNGPAFGALEGDNDPDALVFGHKGRSAAGAKRIDKQEVYPLVLPTSDERCFLRSRASLTSTHAGVPLLAEPIGAG